MPGGILWDGDWERLRNSVVEIRRRRHGVPRPIRLLEIGVDDGRTSRDLINVMLPHTERFLYLGIDLRPPAIEHNHYRHVQGLSRNVYSTFKLLAILIGNDTPLDWILVDGCHCTQCAAWDALNYGTLLSQGGLMVFRDASPLTQGLDPQTYGELDGVHDREEAAKGIQVRKFLDSPEFPSWLKLVSAAPHQARGGVEIYEKR